MLFVQALHFTILELETSVDKFVFLHQDVEGIVVDHDTLGENGSIFENPLFFLGQAELKP